MPTLPQQLTDPTRVPILSWLPHQEIEPGAREQLVNAANHPEVGHHIAAMPDTHVGYGVSIGCVFPTVDAVIPNAVGVDIGCGMSAVETAMILQDWMDKDFWTRWAHQVKRDVPTGFYIQTKPQELDDLDRPLRATHLQPLMSERVAYQIGTLGGGNHFLEAQVDEAGRIWFMVHSGSRHLGKRIADHYHALAKEQVVKRGLTVPKDLESLRTDDQTGRDYLHDMSWATDFALENRRRMLEKMVQAFELHAKTHVAYPRLGGLINCHHNYAAHETHFGESVIVHRKGATYAHLGVLGVIPGSMGSPSYIVRGRGNEDSFGSCSHGAGRRMGRNAIKKQLTIEQFAESIAGTYSQAKKGYLDEAPAAYKDIEVVIGRQEDLIEIVHTLQPLITIKGEGRDRGEGN